jgi:hypothetical protein
MNEGNPTPKSRNAPLSLSTSRSLAGEPAQLKSMSVASSALVTVSPLIAKMASPTSGTAEVGDSSSAITACPVGPVPTRMPTSTRPECITGSSVTTNSAVLLAMYGLIAS